MNKLVYSLVGSAALAASAFAGTAPSGKSAKDVSPMVAAPEEDLGLTLGVAYDSRYYFRGLDLANNWVSSSLDWAIPLNKDLRLDLGANYGDAAGSVSRLGTGDFSTFHHTSFERLQLDANLVATLGPVEVGAGFRWYDNMGDLKKILDNGEEVGVNVATKLGPVNFGVGAYRDFGNDGQGWYFEAAVNTEIKLCDRVSLVPGANIGFGSKYNYQLDVGGFKPQSNTWTDVDLSLALPIKLSKRATLSPYIAFNFPLHALSTVEDNRVFGGVSLAVKF
jgi:hypothetical protein